MNKDTLLEKKYRAAFLKAAQLMVSHGLGDWKIQINSKRRALAQTYFNSKTIKYSKFFLMVADKDQFNGVTLHEIAHALVGHSHGHDKVFVSKCKELGVDERFSSRFSKGVSPTHVYIARCNTCGIYEGVNRRLNGTCVKCLRKGVESEIITEKNDIKVRMW